MTQKPSSLMSQKPSISWLRNPPASGREAAPHLVQSRRSETLWSHAPKLSSLMIQKPSSRMAQKPSSLTETRVVLAGLIAPELTTVAHDRQICLKRLQAEPFQ